jgi:hypothetical protein
VRAGPFARRVAAEGPRGHDWVPIRTRLRHLEGARRTRGRLHLGCCGRRAGLSLQSSVGRRAPYGLAVRAMDRRSITRHPRRDLDSNDNGSPPPGRATLGRHTSIGSVLPPGATSAGSRCQPLAFEQHRPRCLRREHYGEAAGERG